jgi:hypothetical protein
MREITLCLTAFSLSMLLADGGLLPEPGVAIEPSRITLMDCESLYERNYTIEDESGSYRAAGECFFGGYYPSGPTTEL